MSKKLNTECWRAAFEWDIIWSLLKDRNLLLVSVNIGLKIENTLWSVRGQGITCYWFMCKAYHFEIKGKCEKCRFIEL